MHIKLFFAAMSLFSLLTLGQGKATFKDQVILITGASGDIGLHTTRHFLKEEASVVAHYGKNAEQLNELKEEYPFHLKLVSADFRDPNNAKKLWQEALGWKNCINVVVNSAGISKKSETPADSLSVSLETMAINYHSPVVISEAALDHFKKENIPGVIINLGSRAAFRGMPEGCYHYSDSKAALTQFTRQLARDNAKYNILAYTVAPGPVEGQMFDQLAPGPRQQSLESMPTKKVVETQEVVNIIDFYASRKAPSGTGGVFDLMGASWFH